MPLRDWNDDDASTVVINNNTYYESEGVYYEKSTQDGEEGYAVVEEPQQQVLQPDPNQPNPFDILKNGLAFLAKQPQFTMEVSDTYDEVAENGQKVSYTSNRIVYVRRPGSVAIEYKGDGESRRVTFDGKNVTLVDRTNKAYGQAAMPATIDATLDKLTTDYGVTVAVAELLRTDLYDRVYPNIQLGQYLGKDTVGTFECDHVSFTTADTDWEAWFQTGDRPMLRKFSIAYKDVPSRPRYTMVISKFDASEVADQMLKVEIPPDARQVSLTPRNAETSATKPGAQ